MMNSAFKGVLVRFNAQGKILTIDFEVLMNQPESYLSWLAQSSLDLLQHGLPIDINKSPDAVRKMLESYFTNSSSSCPNIINKEVHLQSNQVQKQRSCEFIGKTRAFPPPPPPPPDDDELQLRDAVRDILQVLGECRKWIHLHDKAIFVFRWGRSSNCDRVLRPYTVKMYESLTGKLYDICRSSDFQSTQNLNPSMSGFSSIVVSAQNTMMICSVVREQIMKRIRQGGYSCSFVDIGVNGNGGLFWKNQGMRDPSINVFDGTVRCLVVNTR
eukprot:g8810.t1